MCVYDKDENPAPPTPISWRDSRTQWQLQLTRRHSLPRSRAPAARFVKEVISGLRTVSPRERRRSGTCRGRSRKAARSSPTRPNLCGRSPDSRGPRGAERGEKGAGSESSFGSSEIKALDLAFVAIPDLRGSRARAGCFLHPVLT